MPNSSNLSLHIVGRIGDAQQPHEEREPIIYSVGGMPAGEDYCIIGYAGRDWEGKQKWSLHWYRNAERVVIPEGTYYSPEDALAAMAEILESETPITTAAGN